MRNLTKTSHNKFLSIAPPQCDRDSRMPPFLRCAALSIGLAATTFAASTPITISIDPAHPGAAIAPDFAGFSYEVSALLPAANGQHYFRADNTALITLFHTLGIKSLRIGGNTSDRDAKTLPSESDFDQLFAFAKAADVRVLYCLRLHNGDPALDAVTAKYLMDHYSPWVDAFSIGQEPSAYPKTKIDTRKPSERMGAGNENFAYTNYRNEWARFAAAIEGAVPNVRFYGPSVHNNGEWARRFIADFASDHHVVMVSEHLYAGGAAGKLPSAEVGRDRMLSDSFTKAYQKLYASFVPQSDAAHLPYRLEEVNSYFNGGAEGSSNTFASSLWSLDFMYWWAEHHAAGLNFHTGDAVSMNGEVHAPRYAAFVTGPQGFAIRPLAYGLAAFAATSQGSLIAATVASDAKLNLAAYATLSPDRQVYVTLINKEHGAAAHDASITLRSTKPYALAETMALTDPSGDVAATSGVTLGGAAISASGSWNGTWTRLPSATGDRIVTVPAGSALLVRLTE